MNETQHKALMLLGLARKARKLEIGEEPCGIACRSGKAKLLLDRLGTRREAGLTTPKQIRFLEGRGFRHVGTWSFESAKHMIDRIAANGWKTPRGIDPSTYQGE